MDDGEGNMLWVSPVEAFRTYITEVSKEREMLKEPLKELVEKMEDFIMLEKLSKE
jgi:hypothetical protein